MRPEDVVAVLEENLPARAERPVTLTYEEDEWEIAADEIGLDFDYAAIVDDAMSVGRTGGGLAVLGDRTRAWLSGVDIDVVANADEALLQDALGKIGETTDVAPVEATVKIEGTTPEVVDGVTGRALERTAASRLVVASFAEQEREPLEAPVVVVPLSITAEVAGRAAVIAKEMLTRPVTVVYEDESWEFAPAEVAKWIEFKSSASEDETASVDSVPPSLVPFVSAKAATGPITRALGAGIGRPAKDASFMTSNGRVTIVPSQEGVGPDITSLALSLTDELKDPAADRVVELRTSRVQPKITTDDAREMGIEERISTYTTTYESSNRPRVNNIHLLGDAIDGTLVEPGGVFSFNEAAGERTASKGYQEANAIVNGKLVPQLGGGVCQVGTTIFNTVFESGLPVVERRNHSFYISHYPKGRDATVSWGGPDFKFRNDTKDWVLVSVSYSSSSITISLYGTHPGYDVSAEVGEWTNIRPFEVEEVKDPKMAAGSRIVEDAGISGRSITVKRVVSKGGKVVRTDTFVSNYKPKDQVVRVGTKPKPSSTTTETP
jgi:vancomycin resistance protein YoaR